MPTPPAAARPLFLHPFVQIGLCIVAGTAAEVLLRKGAMNTRPGATLQWLGLTGLESGWTWLSIVFTLLSFFAWISAVRVLPLGVAFPLTNAVQVLVPLSCWMFLGEAISFQRWCGIVLVVLGLMTVAKTYARIDERL